MREVIRQIAAKLNEANINWGIGGSFMLREYGLADEVHDLDLVIAKEDIEKAIVILDSIAIRDDIPLKTEYVTKYFITYKLDDVDIDVMSSFRVKHDKGIYEFIMDDKSITKTLDFDGEFIPLTSLEDWLIAYHIMIGRDVKVGLIKDYFVKNGVGYPELLVRMKDQVLPNETLALIDEMLGL